MWIRVQTTHIMHCVASFLVWLLTSFAALWRVIEVAKPVVSCPESVPLGLVGANIVVGVLAQSWVLSFGERMRIPLTITNCSAAVMATLIAILPHEIVLSVFGCVHIWVVTFIALEMKCVVRDPREMELLAV